MGKVLKWIGIVLGGLLALVVLVAVGLSVAGGARLNKTHDIQVKSITIPTDEAALARGEHLVQVACASCHGSDLSGQPMLDDPAIGTIYASNISGLGESHTDADLVRAIRHAVDTDGRQLAIMPSEAFIHFSAEDLGAVIAYLKTVPPTGNAHPAPQLTFMGRILLATGAFGNVFPAECIDHDQAFAAMPVVGANIEYGEYLSRFCTSCHGVDLGGSQPADPVRPEVWYASVSTGPMKAHSQNNAQAYIFRSVGGSSWQKLAGPRPMSNQHEEDDLPQPLDHMPYALLTDPAAPGHLYAGLNNGDVWHSTDHGDTWQKLPFNLGAIHRTLVMV